MARNRIIGIDGDLPWRLPAEMRRFKRITMGHTVVMGRKTWESLDGPLEGRRNVVLTRQRGYRAEGAEVYHDLDDVPGDDWMIIGGEAIYALALPRAGRLCLSVVHAAVDGDASFPSFEARDWGVLEMTYVPANKRHVYGHTYFDLRRAKRLPRPPLPFPGAVSDWL